MLRKHLFKASPNRSVPQPGEIDIAATTTVQELLPNQQPSHSAA